jgi:hypothetical protein
MSTSITYNGITLELVKTNLISRSPIFSPDGVDYLYTHWDIDINCVYNPGATSYNSDGSSSNTLLPAPTDVNIRHALSLPRQALLITVGSDALINISGVDSNNGPLPKKVDITRITGVSAFYVRFQVECWINECPGDQPPVLLTNRWQVHDHIDENFLTTKITRGVAVFRTDLLVGAANSPDHYRDQAFPPIPLGFKRIQIDATMHPSLNSLSYEVIDQEQVVHIGGPRNDYGVTKFEAFYQVSTTGGAEGGAVSGLVAAQVDVSVYGERDSSNWNLTLFGMKIVSQKLQIGGAAVANGPVLREIAIRQALHGRMVQVKANVLMTPAVGAGPGISILNLVQLNSDQLAIFAKDFTDPQPYDKGSRGSYQWEMTAQIFKDSCGKASRLLNPLQTQSTTTPYDSTTPTVVNVGVGNVPDYQNNKYSSDAYNDYRIDTKYVTDYMNIQAPVANPVSGPGGYSNYSSIMNVASPMTKKIIQWTAERYGDQPKIPNPQPGDSNLTLMSTDIQPAAPGLMVDASSQIYRISGTYVYSMTRPLGNGDTLTTGSLPWTTLSFGDGQYSNWQDGILDIGSSGGSSTGTNN